MGSFNEMIISRPSNGPCNVGEVAVIAEKASQNGIGALVVPNRLASQIVYDGILLNYDEFYYAVAHCPYFFAKGVVCIFDGDTGTNFSLYKNLRTLSLPMGGKLYESIATLIIFQFKNFKEVFVCSK